MWRKLLLSILLSVLLCSVASAVQLKPIRGTQLVHRGSTINRGLVGFWPMNEGGGTKVFDASGNGHTGTITGATWTGGQFGSCLGFDDSGGKYVDCGSWSDPIVFNMSICLWVRANAGDSSGGLVYKGNGYAATSDYYLFWFDSGNGVQFGRGGSAYSAQNLGDATIIDDEVWTHLVFTASGGSGYQQLKAYKNGVLYDTAPSYLTSEQTAAHSLVIGRESWGSLRAFNGLIDAPSIYNRALTPSEIASLYADPWQGYQREPVELYVTTGGAPPAAEHTQVIIVASVPALIVLLALGMTFGERRRAGGLSYE